ncbi:MAG: hypothetical protein HQ503_02115 [Rhodospirillales bacterium]|nr:hypothetical protein [Rhodospirillales bacterium]
MPSAILTPPKAPIGADPGLLAHLRSQIDKIEHQKRGPHDDQKFPARTTVETISTGAASIDAALPWNGLPSQGLHEIFGDTAALSFCAGLSANLGARPQFAHAPILWCQQERDLYGQGLSDAGLDPARLILVHGRNDTEILWAMEEGLRSRSLAAVIGCLKKVPPIAGRRLQLAAEENGTAGFLLRSENAPGTRQNATGAALTRWRVTSAPSAADANNSYDLFKRAPRWRLELQRCRFAMAQGEALKEAGKPRSWLVEWCNETGDFSLAAELRGGAAEPQRETRWAG